MERLCNQSCVGIAVNETEIFVAVYAGDPITEIRRLPKARASTCDIFGAAAAPAGPGPELAASGSIVCWSFPVDFELHCANIHAPLSSSIVVSPAPSRRVGGFAVSGNVVYTVDLGSSGAVHEIILGIDGGLFGDREIGNHRGESTALLADGANVFVAFRDGIFRATDGGLESLGPVAPNSISYVGDLYADATRLYFVAADGSLKSVSMGELPRTELLPNGPDPVSIVGSAERLYFLRAGPCGACCRPRIQMARAP